MTNTPLTEALLKQLFGSQQLQFVLDQGTVRSERRQRQLFVSSEQLLGIYKALNNETGDAWGIVMKNCGFTWGQRLMANLDQELFERHGCRSGELGVDEFCHLIERYFASQGWGRLKIQLGHARDLGIIRVDLQDSLIADALKEVKGPTDFLVAGMLRAIFEHVSERDLDVIQITCRRLGASSDCGFLITAPERINGIEDLSGQSSMEEAIDALRAA